MSVVEADRGAGAAVSPRMRLIVNFAAYQLGWFACVLGAANGQALSGTAVAAAIVAAHIYFAARPLQELKLIVFAVLIGLLWETLLLATGWLEYKGGFLIDGVAPHWILALWALFATTLNVSLAWLKARLITAALLGAIAGPLAFWGGARLGAVVLIAPLPALLALSFGWALLMPLLALLARRHDGIGAAV